MAGDAMPGDATAGDAMPGGTVSGVAPEVVRAVVERALGEDLASAGDVTTLATVPESLSGSAELVTRAAGVVAGLPVAAEVFSSVSAVSVAGSVRIEYRVADGSRVAPGDVLATVTGPARDLLTAERTALNLLCHLSGIATLTRAWVDAIDGTGAAVRDTRKTLPGLRALEKYAVRCGGGVNHRMSLSDAALVKDNHIAAAGGLVAAFDLVRRQYPGLLLEVEADTVEQAFEVIDAGADLVLLDNMTPDEMRAVVNYSNGRAKLEASGGLRLREARAVAETGVDYLAVGALTHSAPALDIGLDMKASA